MKRDPANAEKLDICHLGHKRVPSREGGIEIVVGELAARMVSRGHRVTCYNRSGHHVSGREYDRAALKEWRGVRLKNVWTVNRRGLAAMTASVSASVLAAFGRYDVVHFHAEGPCAMLWLPKLLGKRCVATIHGLDWARSKWGGFASRYIRFGEKVAARRADAVIVLSEDVRRYFMETYGRETVFIPNGVTRPERVEAREIREKYGLEPDGYVLFLGRLVPEKGLDYLVEAWRGVKTDRKLVIAGGSSDTAAYAESLKARCAGDPRVAFTGFVEGRTLAELYSNAYIYVLPSDLEGMPLSLLEAMSYGNCCLTSDIPECAGVAGEHAATFRRSDAASLRGELQRLLDDPAAVAAYRAGAADAICGKYDWEDVVDRTLRLYRGK